MNRFNKSQIQLLLSNGWYLRSLNDNIAYKQDMRIILDDTTGEMIVYDKEGFVDDTPFSALCGAMSFAEEFLCEPA